MVRTATRGVLGFLLVVAFVLAGLFWVPSAARAVEPVAPPVPESPYKTSQLYGYTQAEWDSFDDGTKRGIANRNYALLDEAKRILAANPDAGVDDAPKPAGTPSKLLRGAGVLGLVLAVPMIVNGTLQIVGVSAEVNSTPDEMICAGVGSTAGNVFLSALYGEVECVVPVVNPNVDMPQILTLTGAGMNVQAIGSFTYQQLVSNGPPPVYQTLTNYCLSHSTALPANHSLTMRFGPVESGGGSSIGAGSQSQRNLWPELCGLGAAANGSTAYWYASNIGAHPHWMELRDLTKPFAQQVVATSTTSQANPERLLDCEVKWSDGTTTVAEGLTYTEAEGFPLGAAGCTEAYSQRPSPGVLPEEWSISSTPDEGGARTEIASGDIPAEAGAAPPAETSPDANRGLRLLKVVGTQSLSCMTWEVDCADWWDESESGSSSTTPYRCWYGAVVVDLKECGLYRNTFKSAATRVVTEPSTGEDVQWGTGSNPSNGNGTDPGSVPNPGDACMSSWSAAPNPLEWVAHPVKCAMVAVFVPRVAKVQALVDGVDSAWANTWPRKGMESMATVLAAVPTASGCSGPHIQWSTDWPAPIDFDAYPLSACDEPIATLAWWARVLGAFMLIGYTAWGVTRRVGSVVNAPGAGPS